MEPKKSGLTRYASIDILRGFALFANVAVHIFTDVFNLGPLTDNLFSLPLMVLLMLIMVGYFGSYGSFFIMISATGNCISMQKQFSKGKNFKQVVLRQFVNGLILLVFSFLVEGLFQYYGYLGTIFAWNGHEHDLTRIIWHAYSITPVTCLAGAMILSAVVDWFVTLNEGYKKIKRNMIIYGFVATFFIAIGPAVWAYCKTIGPAGFPNAYIGTIYPGEWPGDYRVYMPPPDASFLQYIQFFFLAMAGGSNHPIFPFAAMYFIGNIIGLALVNDTQSITSTHLRSTPKKGILLGVVVFLIGVLLIPILGVDFGSVLPVDAVGDITKVHDGLDGFWLPWFCFLLAGEIIIMWLVLVLIEYRGIGAQLAEKTKFIRRFGMPAFSVYAWHRFWAMPVLLLIAWLAGSPPWTGGSITEASYDWGFTLVAVIAVWLFCGVILWLWEKIGYIGGIEWMMGEVAAIFGKNMRKSKGTTKDHARWWEYGKMDVDAIFYNPTWIELVSRNPEYFEHHGDSRLALLFAKAGLFFGPFAIIGWQIGRTAQKLENNSWSAQKSVKLGKIGCLLFIIEIVLLSILTLPLLGINL